MLQVPVPLFGKLQLQVKQTFPKLRGSLHDIFSTLLASLPPGISNCKPRFVIKWCKTLRLRLMKCWLPVYFWVYSGAAVRIPVVLQYSLVIFLPLPISHRTYLWFEFQHHWLKWSSLFWRWFLYFWLQVLFSCSPGETVTKFLFEPCLLFLNAHMLLFCKLFPVNCLIK